MAPPGRESAARPGPVERPPACTSPERFRVRDAPTREGDDRCRRPDRARSPPSTCRPSCGSPTWRSRPSATAREEIDALNVYPVPDGDTGTNMFLTFEAARAALRRGRRRRRRRVARAADLRTALAAFARGALLGARGNSGVIFSSLVGALCKRLGEAGPGDRSAQVLRRGPRRWRPRPATPRSASPVEGTILSVARAASEAADRVGRGPATAPVGHVVRAAAARGPRGPGPHARPAARCSRDAGVVDAGGRGLCVVLDAAETAVTGTPPGSAPPAARVPGDPDARCRIRRPDARRSGLRGDVPARRRRRRRSRRCAPPWPRSATRSWSSAATGCGTSTCTSTTSVPPSRPASRRAGRTGSGSPTSPSRLDRRTTPGAVERTGRAVVVVAAGAGLGELFVQAGRHGRRRAGPGRRPSTGQLLEAITSGGAAEVVVLPNDRDSIAAAEAAARTAREESGVRVAVIPTTAQVQGLAALAVHEPGPALRAGRPGDDGRGPARPLRRRHRRGPAGDDHGRAVRAGRRARRDRGRLRGRSATTCSTVATDVARAAARRWRRAGHPGGRRGRRRPGRAVRGAPRARPARPSTWSSTTAASSATRCWSGSSSRARRTPRSTIRWDSKLAAVAGNGAAKIEKAFGYQTVGDLLRHYPRRWVDKGSLSRPRRRSSPTSTSP